jgi:hypothetical protein
MEVMATNKQGLAEAAVTLKLKRPTRPPHSYQHPGVTHHHQRSAAHLGVLGQLGPDLAQRLDGVGAAAQRREGGRLVEAQGQLMMMGGRGVED